MAKRPARPSVLAKGSFGAFVLDQLNELGDVVARPMFGGAGFYLDGVFFGLLYDKRLYFRVSPETIGEYTSRKMTPFAPFGGKRGKRGESEGYYEVPVEILESPGDLIKWARASQRTPPLSSSKKRAPGARVKR
jgi:DNA transformation protein and related proteins